MHFKKIPCCFLSQELYFETCFSRKIPIVHMLVKMSESVNCGHIIFYFPKEWEVWVPQWAPHSRGPALRVQAFRILGFEGQQGLLLGEPKFMRNRDPTPKMFTWTLTYYRVQIRSNNLKVAHVRPTCCSWRASGGGRGQLGFMWEMQTLAVISEVCSTMRMTVLASINWNPSPPTTSGSVPELGLPSPCDQSFQDLAESAKSKQPLS